MSAPLPPRPNQAPKVIPEVQLSESPIEHVRMEQEAGRAAVELSKLRLEQEMEAGRKQVEINEKRKIRNITKDSE